MYQSSINKPSSSTVITPTGVISHRTTNTNISSTPSSSSSSSSTPLQKDNNSSNILKSPSFPFVSRSWELNTFDSYMKFRAHYVNVKSTKYLVKALSLMVLSIGVYCYLFEAGSILLPIVWFYSLLIGSSVTLGLGSAMLAQHFQQVPEVILSEEQRQLYQWPSNFPSSPPVSTASSSSRKDSLIQEARYGMTLDSISPYKPANNSSSSTSTSSVVGSNTTNNNTTGSSSSTTTTTSSTTGSNISPVSNKTTSTQSTVITPTSSTSSVQQKSPITSPYSYRSTRYTPPKSIEIRENEEISNHFQGRLFTSLSEFVTSQFDKEVIDQNDRSNHDKDKSIYVMIDLLIINNHDIIEIFEIEPLSQQHYGYEAPIQSYRVLQRSKVIEPTKVSYEDMVASKYLQWKNMCEAEHLYNMISAANACSRWFTENIIKPLVAPAEAYLAVKDEKLLSLVDERGFGMAKCSFLNLPTLDIMKNVLKHTIYHLDRLNDVHHKKESEHICRRIKELSKDGYVFHTFGNKSNDQNDLQQPTDEQLLFALFLAYMDEKLYKDVTAPIPDLPFSSKYIKDDNSKQVFKYVPIINITYKRPLHLDILTPQYESFKLIDISPGLQNIFFTIVLFFYYITKYNDGYIDNMDISKLNVNIFLNSLINDDSNDDEDDIDLLEDD
ncbi:hypothetical protein PPL_06599 [Heterostelium album PN500]|uniref:Transmembrane protein n=1 Tax=Heterostelium pallidum (strain ATCC 26659 / Pp 5 / PN500) TaxID=670386 RepID=D3BF66_HETP5|nr:hypothetical protein PPL_06599 [Heterostelium album PN500]EFA79780.1 hypothetical protein PPL_06599 [Heterostelium album PN500]|eukprot:XP_020431901.1 hypothetical protein PPL_06599 [Heterostelium album PN500]